MLDIGNRRHLAVIPPSDREWAAWASQQRYRRIGGVLMDLIPGRVHQQLSTLAHPTAYSVVYPLTGEHEISTRAYFTLIGRMCGESALQIIGAALQHKR